MAKDKHDPTIEKTEWTGALIEDLCDALRNKRDDNTVRAFAKELMNEKGLPISYLVNKVNASVGSTAGERLNLLVRGRHAVEKEKAEQAKASKGGVFGGLIRKFMR